MKTTEVATTMIEPDEGMCLRHIESGMLYKNKVFLAKSVSPDDYEEVPLDAESEETLTEQNEVYEAQMKQRAEEVRAEFEEVRAEVRQRRMAAKTAQVTKADA